MDVSVYDRWIVRLGTVYLVAVAYEDTGMCRLSDSPYDALPFESYADAAEIANRAGGKAVRFNRVTGTMT